MCSLVSLQNEILLKWSRNPALRCTFHTQAEECDSEQIFAYTSPLIHYKYVTCFIFCHTTIYYLQSMLFLVSIRILPYYILRIYNCSLIQHIFTFYISSDSLQTIT